jgi:hypothetical protein
MLIHTGSFQVTAESFSTWNVCLYYVWFPQFHAIRDRATDRPLVEVPSPAWAERPSTPYSQPPLSDPSMMSDTAKPPCVSSRKTESQMTTTQLSPVRKCERQFSRCCDFRLLAVQEEITGIWSLHCTTQGSLCPSKHLSPLQQPSPATESLTTVSFLRVLTSGLC